MSLRIDKSWVVVVSIENDQADRCVDIFRRPDGTFGYEEFRRDVEDRGQWTPTAFYSQKVYATADQARAAAASSVRWFAEGRIRTQARPARLESVVSWQEILFPVA